MILKLLSLLIIAPTLANVSPIDNKASSLISSREDLKVAISAAKDGDVILVDDMGSCESIRRYDCCNVFCKFFYIFYAILRHFYRLILDSCNADLCHIIAVNCFLYLVAITIIIIVCVSSYCRISVGIVVFGNFGFSLFQYFACAVQC